MGGHDQGIHYAMDRPDQGIVYSMCHGVATLNAEARTVSMT